MSYNTAEVLGEIETLVNELNHILQGPEYDYVDIQGISKPTISEAIRLSFSKLQATTNGIKGFGTYAEMISSGAPAAGQSNIAWVTNDPSVVNNGTYLWNGSTWVKSTYDIYNSIEKLKVDVQTMLKTEFNIHANSFIPKVRDGILSPIPTAFLAAISEVYISGAEKGKYYQIGSFLNDYQGNGDRFVVYEFDAATFETASVAYAVHNTANLPSLIDRSLDTVVITLPQSDRRPNLSISLKMHPTRFPPQGTPIYAAVGMAGASWVVNPETVIYSEGYLQNNSTSEFPLRILPRMGSEYRISAPNYYIKDSILDIKIFGARKGKLYRLNYCYNGNNGRFGFNIREHDEETYRTVASDGVNVISGTEVVLSEDIILDGLNTKIIESTIPGLVVQYTWDQSKMPVVGQSVELNYETAGCWSWVIDPCNYSLSDPRIASILSDIEIIKANISSIQTDLLALTDRVTKNELNIENLDERLKDEEKYPKPLLNNFIYYQYLGDTETRLIDVAFRRDDGLLDFNLRFMIAPQPDYINPNGLFDLWRLRQRSAQPGDPLTMAGTWTSVPATSVATATGMQLKPWAMSGGSWRTTGGSSAYADGSPTARVESVSISVDGVEIRPDQVVEGLCEKVVTTMVYWLKGWDDTSTELLRCTLTYDVYAGGVTVSSHCDPIVDVGVHLYQGLLFQAYGFNSTIHQFNAGDRVRKVWPSSGTEQAISDGSPPDCPYVGLRGPLGDLIIWCDREYGLYRDWIIGAGLPISSADSSSAYLSALYDVAFRRFNVGQPITFRGGFAFRSTPIVPNIDTWFRRDTLGCPGYTVGATGEVDFRVPVRNTDVGQMARVIAGKGLPETSATGWLTSHDGYGYATAEIGKDVTTEIRREIIDAEPGARARTMQEVANGYLSLGGGVMAGHIYGTGETADGNAMPTIAQVRQEIWDAMHGTEPDIGAFPSILSENKFYDTAQPVDWLDLTQFIPRTGTTFALDNSYQRRNGVYPRNGQTVYQVPPHFLWPSLGAVNGYSRQYTYQVEVRGSDGIVQTIDTGVFPDHRCYVSGWPTNLVPGQEYSWRVKVNGRDDGENAEWTSQIWKEWSEWRTFKIHEKAIVRRSADIDALYKAAAAKTHPRTFPIGDELDSLKAKLTSIYGQELSDMAASVDSWISQWPNHPVIGTDSDYMNSQELTQQGAMVFLARVGYRSNFMTQAINRFISYQNQTQCWDYNYRNFREATKRFAQLYDWTWDYLSDANRAMLSGKLADCLWYQNDNARGWDNWIENIGVLPYVNNVAGDVAQALGLICCIAGDGPTPDQEEIIRVRFGRCARMYMTTDAWSGEDASLGNSINYSVLSMDDPIFGAHSFRSSTGYDPSGLPHVANYLFFYAYFLPPVAGDMIPTACTAFGDGAEQPVYQYYIRAMFDGVSSHMASRSAKGIANWYSKQMRAGARVPVWEWMIRPVDDSGADQWPSNAPRSAFFPEGGLVAMHTSLPALDRRSVYFRASQFSTINHQHADNNSFVVHRGGDQILIDSGFYDEYSNNPNHYWMQWYSSTKAHNAVTHSGGVGQARFTITAKAKVISYAHKFDHTVVIADATLAYAAEDSTVTRMVRALIWLPDQDVLLVWDANSAETARTWEYHYHAETAFVDSGDGRWMAQSKIKNYPAWVRMYSMTTLATSQAQDPTSPFGTQGQYSLTYRSVSVVNNEAVSVVQCSAEAPTDISVNLNGKVWNITAGEKIISINNGVITVQ